MRRTQGWSTRFACVPGMFTISQSGATRFQNSCTPLKNIGMIVAL